MKECAFCNHIGKLSNEHIVSEWIGALFPGKLSAWYRAGSLDRRFKTDSMDWKAGVVCETCNNTWMSNIENDHAKPALTPLITGKVNIPITPSVARSIAIFAFKTAVVVDHANRDRLPFFSRRLRHNFHKHLVIPEDVRMWFFAYAGHRGGGHVNTIYHEGKTPSGNNVLMYVCTCAFGNFAFQVLAVKQIGRAILRPLSGIQRHAVPFWPRISANVVWPPKTALRSMEDFRALSDAWEHIEIIGE